MNNTLIRIDKVLKTKEALQSFVLIALVLFVLFVKGYMLLTDHKVVNKQVNNTSNTKASNYSLRMARIMVP